jgi:hypothetical protein
MPPHEVERLRLAERAHLFAGMTHVTIEHAVRQGTLEPPHARQYPDCDIIHADVEPTFQPAWWTKKARFVSCM